MNSQPNWERERAYTAPDGTLVSMRAFARHGDRDIHVGIARRQDGSYIVFAGDNSHDDGHIIRTNSYQVKDAVDRKTALAIRKDLMSELSARVVKAHARKSRRGE